MGTIEMPEAIRQRVVFIYVRPAAGEWLNYQSTVTSHGKGLLETLNAANLQHADKWVPTDMAGEASAFERSATKFCKLLQCYYGLRKRGDYNGVDADLVLDALAHGQLGTIYWETVVNGKQSPRTSAFAGATLVDCKVDPIKVMNDPMNADLPPDGLWTKVIEALEIVNDDRYITSMDTDHWLFVYANRFPSEGKAALDRHWGDNPNWS